MFFVAIERRIAVRMAAMAAIVGIGYCIVLLAFHYAGASAQPGGMPDPPAGADAALNPAIFVRGGTFLTGNADQDPDVNPFSPYSTTDEKVREVTIESFWMQEHEVTNAEYVRFDADHTFAEGMDDHPVVDVTWLEAQAYAQSIGGSLPTEFQWEFAARGTESRKYPWGDEEPTCDRAQFAGCEPRTTLPVRARPAGATPEGLHDLAGNVWEWVMPDWFDPDRTPVNRATRRQRGGSFVEEAFFLRAANRNNEFYAGYRSPNVGFRVVWPVED